MEHPRKVAGLARVVSITNQKGGVGKTTTAVNVAACLAYAGRRVLLVDLDPQGNATSGIGLEKLPRGGSELLVRGSKPKSGLRETRVPLLWAIPASLALKQAELELAHERNREFHVRSSLHFVLERFDNVILDCPPSLGIIPANALVASDGVIIPIQCEYYAMEGLAQILATIDGVKKGWNAGLAIQGILLTMWDGAVQLALDVESEVRRHFEDRVYRTVIPRDPALAEAPSHGLPIIDYAPRSKGASSYVRLTKEILANERTQTR